jgi:4-amino-4-deoxychorismate lyase
MCQLLETIKLEDGVLKSISLHNERFNYVRAKLFGASNKISLEKEIQLPISIKKGIYKCRIIYSTNIESVEFSQYLIKPVKTLKLVYDNDIIYNYKYLDRTCIEKHMKHISEDDILIVKSGLITDVSFANIVFFDGLKWITPTLPLLEGTKRKYLLAKKLIFEDEIKPNDLKHFKKTRLINAMLDLETSPDIEIVHIVF